MYVELTDADADADLMLMLMLMLIPQPRRQIMQEAATQNAVVNVTKDIWPKLGLPEHLVNSTETLHGTATY